MSVGTLSGRDGLILLKKPIYPYPLYFNAALLCDDSRAWGKKGQLKLDFKTTPLIAYLAFVVSRIYIRLALLGNARAIALRHDRLLSVCRSPEIVSYIRCFIMAIAVL